LVTEQLNDALDMYEEYASAKFTNFNVVWNVILDKETKLYQT